MKTIKEKENQKMNAVKIYKIYVYHALEMAATGERFSLAPWGKNTPLYEGETVGCEEYALPDGFNVIDTEMYGRCILDENGKYAEFVTKDGKPVLITDKGYVTLEPKQERL